MIKHIYWLAHEDIMRLIEKKIGSINKEKINIENIVLTLEKDIKNASR